MKSIIAGIIMLQFGFYGNAQNYTDVGMIKPSINNPVTISEKNNFTLADTSMPSTKRVAPWFVERFRISAGFFLPSSNTDISVGTNNGDIGTDINFENDLGLKKNIGTFLADLQWRTSRRSRFDLSYYRVDRNSTYTLQKDINFGDHTYGIDASVKSFLIRIFTGFLMVMQSWQNQSMNLVH